MKIRNSRWLILILFTACAPSKEVKLHQFLIKGNGMLKEGNSEEAERYFKEAVKLDPCFVEGLNNLGTIRFGSGNWDEALDYYNKAIICDPKFLDAYYNRANTFYELKQYYNALQDVHHVMRIKPDTAVVHFAEGLIATKMRDFPTALKAFDRALSFDSSNVEFLVNRGTVKYYLHDFVKAEDDLREAERRNPKEPNIYNTRAMIAISKGAHDVALVEIEKALQLTPDQPFFINNRGFVYLMQNKLDAALIDIDRSIVLDPTNGWAVRNKGIYYLLSGNYPKAVQLLRQALVMDPFIERIHFYLGMAYLKSNQKVEACKQFVTSDRAGDAMVTPELLRLCR